MIDTEDHDEDGRLLWHGVVTALLIEGIAVALFLVTACIWIGVLAGRI